MRRHSLPPPMSADDRLAALREFDHFLREENGFDSGDQADYEDFYTPDINYNYISKPKSSDNRKAGSPVRVKK